jgi:hypothetical protein
MSILRLVAELNLPDHYVAAGFVRNMVWDHLFSTNTLLNDVDVIFYDPDDKEHYRESTAQSTLEKLDPSIKWQVKNQAFMHVRNGDPNYSCCADAMSYWPEKETAVAVKLLADGQIEVCAPFGVQSLIDGKLSYNPKRTKAVFHQRLEKKQWLNIWPKLRVVE